jgi:hypothetical protein
MKIIDAALEAVLVIPTNSSFILFDDHRFKQAVRDDTVSHIGSL